MAVKLLLTPIQLLTLAALLRCPQHPYSIRKEILDLAGHRIGPTALPKDTAKRAIHDLVASGYVQESGNSFYWLASRAIPYEITQQGRHRLERELRLYLRVMHRVKLELFQIARHEAEAEERRYWHPPPLALKPLPHDISPVE